MNLSNKAQLFKRLHKRGDPIVLYNIWDAGSAVAIAAAGASAVATGSWSVAAAHGYADGQAMPLDFALGLYRRIAAATDLPCTIDFEGGFAENPNEVAENVSRMLETGAIGINFEDQVVGGNGLFDIAGQCARISAIRQRAETNGQPLFINARTDLFLKAGVDEDHATILDQAKSRAAAYADAGADSFFAPALVDPDLIADLCNSSTLPVNIMMMKGSPSVEDLAALGVARVSYGPGPFQKLMQALTKTASAIYGN